MQISEVTAEEYGHLFPSPQHVFNSVRFTELNAPKVSKVIRLCFHDGKPRLGLTVGCGSDGSLRAPFSAPFSGFDFNRVQSVATVTAAVEALRARMPGLRLSLPPAPYSPEMNFRTLCALVDSGASQIAEWNYHFDLSGNCYESLLTSPERKKLHRARRSGFRLEQVNDDPMRAYGIIRVNRAQRNHPLRMSAEQVAATTSGPDPVVRADFFVLTNGSEDAAAAMVYHVAAGIAQVVYWGHDERVTACPFPVNLIAAGLYDHYRSLGFRTLDIGPSSENGVPSIGLCNFKDSIGCQLTPKPVFIL